jgi:hypothetical protein
MDEFRRVVDCCFVCVDYECGFDCLGGVQVTTARRKPSNRSQDRQHKRKNCIDCVDEGVTTGRKAPFPGPRCATHHRAKRASRRSQTQEQRWVSVYGISAKDYYAIYEHQGQACFICRRNRGLRKRLSVDHCHKTGLLRGLLCQPCNRDVLGHARDEVEFFERAIEYLNNPPASKALGGNRYVPD